MRKVIYLCFCLSALPALAGDWTPTRQFLNAIRHVESSGGVNVNGDGGKSLGDFQLQRGAWDDVNKWRKARQLKLYDYDNHVFNQYINRVYAANYVSILREQLVQRLRREPTTSEIYAAYNIGMAKFEEQCRLDIRRVNSMTARKCREITAMLADNS